MQLKANTLFILSLIPFPLMSFEFLPNNIIWYYISFLIIRIFKEVHFLILTPIVAFLLYQLKLTFGNLFLPEPMISFLALSCMTRIIGIDKSDYKINRFLGLLWIASFALFKSDISYLFFMIISLFLIFKTINIEPNEKVNLIQLFKLKKVNFKEIIIGSFIVILLFIFFPRFYGFLPRANQPHQGKIGYSKEINNSTITNLLNSSKLAFIAETGIKIPNRNLYWRGSVHNFTDGYNWRFVEMKPIRIKVKVKNPLEYKLKYEQDFGGDLILLDTPMSILKSNFGHYSKKTTNTFKSYINGRKSIITATSSINGYQSDLSSRNIKAYLQLPGLTPKVFKKLVVDLNLKNKKINHIIKMFSVYLTKNEFSYTLNPGDVSTLAKFITKKKGYCTHYASLFGITLRYLGIPSRLVSGFQGGIYNEIGGYYSISSNDAHTWVEAKVNNKWIRIDPTGFINPSRIDLGGEQYFSNPSEEFIESMRNKNSNFVNYLKQVLSIANYKLSLFIDSFDLSEQKNISKKLKVSRKIFFLLGFVILIILIFVFYLLTGKRKKELLIHDKYFIYFIKLCAKNDILIEDIDNLAQIREKLLDFPKAIIIVKLYEKIKYQGQVKHTEELKNLIYKKKIFQ